MGEIWSGSAESAGTAEKAGKAGAILAAGATSAAGSTRSAGAAGPVGAVRASGATGMTRIFAPFPSSAQSMLRENCFGNEPLWPTGAVTIFEGSEIPLIAAVGALPLGSGRHPPAF